MEDFDTIEDMMIHTFDYKKFTIPVISYLLELSDIMNENKTNLLLGCKMIKKLLKSKIAGTRLNIIVGIELFVKNCSIDFHNYLLDKDFCKILLKILEKRRGVPYLFNSLITKNMEIQNEIENKLLYLIQLWYDTFMLYEKEYQYIIDIYKQLRKEQIVFPQREAKNKFMINFGGEKSPIFEAIEDNKIYEEPLKKFKKKKNFEVKSDDIFNKNQKLYDYQAEVEHYDNFKKINDQEKENIKKLKIDLNQIKIIKEKCIILNDFLENVQILKLFKEDYIFEIVKNLKENLDLIKKKIKSDNKDVFLDLIKLSYQTIKKILNEYDSLYEAIELNNGSRPSEYEKIEIKGLLNIDLDNLDNNNNNKIEKNNGDQKNNDDEIDIFNFNEEKVEKKEEEKLKNDNLDILNFDNEPIVKNNENKENDFDILDLNVDTKNENENKNKNENNLDNIFFGNTTNEKYTF